MTETTARRRFARLFIAADLIALPTGAFAANVSEANINRVASSVTAQCRQSQQPPSLEGRNFDAFCQCLGNEMRKDIMANRDTVAAMNPEQSQAWSREVLNRKASMCMAQAGQ